MLPLLLLLLFVLLPQDEAGKIVGGREAAPHSRPYMAYLQGSDGNNQVTICGGFLVREDTVVTAAHCLRKFITVTLGAHDVMSREKTWQVIPVRKAYPHPYYNGESLINDIMLLQLQRNATLTKEVGLLKLPKRIFPTIKPGMVCSVAGWGLLDNNIAADKLHEVDVEIQSERICQYFFSNYQDNIQICAGNLRMVSGSHKGDSGGPLVCGNTAQGIVSYKRKNSIKNPRVLTRISSFLPWIKRTMRSFKLQD